MPCSLGHRLPFLCSLCYQFKCYQNLFRSKKNTNAGGSWKEYSSWNCKCTIYCTFITSIYNLLVGALSAVYKANSVTRLLGRLQKTQSELGVFKTVFEIQLVNCILARMNVRINVTRRICFDNGHIRVAVFEPRGVIAAGLVAVWDNIRKCRIGRNKRLKNKILLATHALIRYKIIEKNVISKHLQNRVITKIQ